MVVLAIIMAVSAVVITSQGSFNKTIILANTAYDIALTIRSAQSFGIGSRNRASAINTGYGVHIGEGNSFTLFADTLPAAVCDRPDCNPGNYLYEGGDEFVNTYTLGNGITIDDFCVDDGITGYSCEHTSLDIVFVRPNPDAFIHADGSSAVSYARACLVVVSPQGGEKYVSVSKSGQIVANAPPCP